MVVNMCDGRSLGYVCDLVLECPCGKVCAIVVPGCQGFKNFFKNRNFIISWCDIVKIGDDIILVNTDLGTCSVAE